MKTSAISRLWGRSSGPLVDSPPNSLWGSTPRRWDFSVSDSQLVLSLSINPRNCFKVFVSNWVYLLRQLVPSCHWEYVRSAENPVDYASRGLCPSDLVKNLLYWSGPAFLTDTVETWDMLVALVPIEQLWEIWSIKYFWFFLAIYRHKKILFLTVFFLKIFNVEKTFGCVKHLKIEYKVSHKLLIEEMKKKLSVNPLQLFISVLKLEFS